MRVLMLSWEYPPHVVGGLGSHVADLVPALDAAGVQVTLITPRWKGGPTLETLPGGSSIHRVDPPVGDLANFLADVIATNVSLQGVAEAVLQASAGSAAAFDVIHVHDWMVSFAGITVKHAHKVPLVATLHATERGRSGGHLESALNLAINGNEWWLCYEAWRVITTTHYMAGEATDYFRVPSDKIVVIPNGVDTTRFDRLPPRGDPRMRAFRRRYAADDEQLVFHVGRLVGEKGAPLIVSAAPTVLAVVPSAKFVIAGTGPLADELRGRVRAMGLASKFYFTGFVPDDVRDALYRVSDVAVFPSLYEPFGIVALEAMAARTPVVVASSGGLAEVVEHDVTGVTVYPNDAASLAWGIVHTLDHPDWTAARVLEAYARVKAVYNWERIAGETAALYRRVATERRAANW